MRRDKRRLRKQDLYFLSKQTVVIDDFESDGFILDIGGGGEGVIGQLKGKQVVSIDLNKEELLEAANAPLKIVMDATELRFLDDSFGSVTASYSLMYMSARDHERVFGEVFRVLKGEGSEYGMFRCHTRSVRINLDLQYLLKSSSQIER